MTSMEKLAPLFDAYSEKVKRRRNELGMTISALSDKSGVPYSNVSRVNSGVQANPLLYNEAAIADTLGLSLDDLCGLDHAAGSQSDLQAKVHKLEVENARLTATTNSQRAQIKSVHSFCYLLIFFCVFFAMSITVYLVFDAKVKNAGLMQEGKLSIAVLVFIGLIVASIVTVGLAIIRIIRKENQHEESQSPRS